MIGILDEDIQQILYDEAEIASVVEELGQRINEAYAGTEPLLITVLRGGMIFIADLMRQIDLPVSTDFMAISSYGPESSSGVVQVVKDLDELIIERDVILVEDIIDTGLTLNYLTQIIMAKKPQSLKVCALLDKSVRRIADVPIAYKGFDLPDVFIVGYGLDYHQLYRNLPYIGILKEDLLNESSF